MDAERYRELDAKPFHEFTNADLSDLLTLRMELRQRGLPPAAPSEEIGFFGRKAMGQPYRLNAGLYDLASADCVCFVDRALALSCATDWARYYKLLKRLRYRDGVVTFLETNFFTLADWVPNNQWLLRDITQDLGPTTTFVHEVRRKWFYGRLQFGQDDTELGRAKAAAQAAKVAAAPEVETLLIHYVAKDQLPDALPKLRTGDVALVIRRMVKPVSKQSFLDCDHVGLIVVDENGDVLLAHAAPPRARQQDLKTFMRMHTAVQGFVFLRLRDDAAQTALLEAARVEPDSLSPQPENVDRRNKTNELRRAQSGAN